MKKFNPCKKRILFLSTFVTPFIQHDIEILENFAEVNILITSGIKGVFKIIRNIFFCDILFCWFASVYSGIAVFLGKLLGKQTIVVIAGVDVASLDEIGYGIWLSKWKRPFVRSALRSADTVLAVDPSLANKAKKLACSPGTNIHYLPFGFDPNFFTPIKSKEKIVLTVSSGATEIRLKTKGIDFLLHTASDLPDIPFYLIGIKRSLFDSLNIAVPQNVTLLPAMEQRDLLSYYQRAAVYCQPSRSEGLPNALCEAMLCECVPVGTRVGGIPTAIGDAGFIIPFGSAEEMKDALRKALNDGHSLGKKARIRIMDKFPLPARIDGLKKLVLDTE